MELSLETCRDIVRNVGNRADIAALCIVSKSFQHVGERALYNTLYMRNVPNTLLLCETLSRQPRVSALVDALTIYLSDSEDDSNSEEDDSSSLVETYWNSIARALEMITRLRYLNIHIDNSSNTSMAWIFRDCTFQLHTFHCDLAWDRDLVRFLNNQFDLDDMYIIDYNDLHLENYTDVISSPTSSLSLDNHSLPNLSILECTFTEAASAIIPGRPITHLKTCFSQPEVTAKRAEMACLFSKIKLSASPLRALDIADSFYTEVFSMEILTCVVSTRATNKHLRYVGTLALPIAGPKRLQFYGLLMRLPLLQCIEVEISEWEPAPTSPPAFRALANEIRLYCPTIIRVVFVHEFDRTVVTVVDGICRMDTETSTDILWREI